MKGLLLFTALILATTVSVAYSLTLFDNIVHGTLYNYGLQFSYDWATPYWTILRTIQVLVGLIAVFTLLGTVYVHRKYVNVKTETKAIVREKPTAAPSIAVEPELPGVSGLVKCDHCGKAFAQPLRMLDFHSDRPRIVNICPFCNEVIPPVLRQELLERDRKAVQREKRNNQAKVVRESQEERQAQRKEEAKEAKKTEETVAASA